MRIRLLEDPSDAVVAREVQFGEFEAEFRVSASGEVWYVHPADTKHWYAGASLEQFKQAAMAWNDYNDSVHKELTEEHQLDTVDRLWSRLKELGALSSADNNLWLVLVQQAEWGHL